MPKGQTKKQITKLFAIFQWTGNVGQLHLSITVHKFQNIKQVIRDQSLSSVQSVLVMSWLIKIVKAYRIMRYVLHFFPYKIQALQPVSVYTGDRREWFANNLPQKVDASEINVGSNWFSDTANIYLDCFKNKQNWWTWELKIPMFQCNHHCTWGKNHDMDYHL